MMQFIKHGSKLPDLLPLDPYLHYPSFSQPGFPWKGKMTLTPKCDDSTRETTNVKSKD